MEKETKIELTFPAYTSHEEKVKTLCVALLDVGYCVRLKEPNHVGLCGYWVVQTWREK